MNVFILNATVLAAAVAWMADLAVPCRIAGEDAGTASLAKSIDEPSAAGEGRPAPPAS